MQHMYIGIHTYALGWRWEGSCTFFLMYLCTLSRHVNVGVLKNHTEIRIIKKVGNMGPGKDQWVDIVPIEKVYF
jgi:hypothetical protein